MLFCLIDPGVLDAAEGAVSDPVLEDPFEGERGANALEEVGEEKREGVGDEGGVERDVSRGEGFEAG